jgi:hypothetical protein
MRGGDRTLAFVVVAAAARGWRSRWLSCAPRHESAMTRRCKHQGVDHQHRATIRWDNLGWETWENSDNDHCPTEGQPLDSSVFSEPVSGHHFVAKALISATEDKDRLRPVAGPTLRSWVVGMFVGIFTRDFAKSQQTKDIKSISTLSASIPYLSRALGMGQVVDDGGGIVRGNRGLIGCDHLLNDLFPRLLRQRRLVHQMIG